MRRTMIGVGEQVNGPNSYYLCFAKAAKNRVESFYVTTLNGAHEIIRTYEVTRGLVNRTMVHPREVFWFAIKDMAADIIVAHNHPSGRVDPSSEDMDITKRLCDAGNLLGIHVLDHLIIGKDGFFSFCEHSILPEAKEYEP